jgi:hypothetical protein
MHRTPSNTFVPSPTSAGSSNGTPSKKGGGRMYLMCDGVVEGSVGRWKIEIDGVELHVASKSVKPKWSTLYSKTISLKVRI